MWRTLVIVVSLSLSSGCLFKMGEDFGGGLVEGALSKAAQSEEEPGVNGLLKGVVDEGVVAELGEQLGAGLISGAGTIDEAQREGLELLVDGVVHSALQRTGRGWRDEVAPELRRTIQQDVVDTLVTGLNGPIGDSLETTVDRTVDAAIMALRDQIQDPELRIMIAEMLREAVYIAVREGRPGAPGVAETLELTLSDNVLSPFEDSVDSISANVANRVDEQNQRLENTLKGIISFLVLVIGVFSVLFFLNRRALDQERTSARAARAGVEELDAALQLLDMETRTKLLGEARAKLYTSTSHAARSRSGDYERNTEAGGLPDPTRPTGGAAPPRSSDYGAPPSNTRPPRSPYDRGGDDDA